MAKKPFGFFASLFLDHVFFFFLVFCFCSLPGGLQKTASFLQAHTTSRDVCFGSAHGNELEGTGALFFLFSLATKANRPELSFWFPGVGILKLITFCFQVPKGQVSLGYLDHGFGAETFG